MADELSSDERRSLALFVEVNTPSAAASRAAAARALVEIEKREAASRRSGFMKVALVAVALAAAAVLIVQLDLPSRLASREQDDGSHEAAYAQPDTSGGADGEAVPREPQPQTREESTRDEEHSDPGSPAESEPSPEPTTRRRPRPRPRDKETIDATLAAEIALLKPAQQALRAGQYRLALEKFDDHEKSFPDSALAPERSAGRIQALCGLDRDEEAAAAIERFEKRFPGSRLLAKVERACAE